MTISDFIFSEKPSVHKFRHLVFWLGWGFYFYVIPGLLDDKPCTGFVLNIYALANTLLILVVQISAFYSVVYYLIPRYLLKRDYLSFILGMIIVGFTLIGFDYFIWLLVNGQVHSTFNFDSNSVEKGFSLRYVLYNGLFISPAKDSSPLMYDLQWGLFSAPKVIAVGAAITFLKRWYIKQKENERIEREKVKAELDLLKVQLHPRFLFNTLTAIYAYSLTASDKAENMILKLSEMLSYMLYDCNQSVVLLEKELNVLQDYIALEKMKCKGRLDVNLQITGDYKNKLIAPLLLLHFLENSIKYSTEQAIKHPWISVIISIHETKLSFKLTGSKSNDEIIPGTGEPEDLYDLRKRLDALYPQRYELLLLKEEDIYMISLALELEVISINSPSEKFIGEPILT
ncbi:sensor histidine kinase [Solitalea canadensis]|nr:histidine kinase [Solitalea canadensis]